MGRLLLIPVLLISLLGASMIWSGTGRDRPPDFSFINRGENKCLDPNGMSWLQDIRLAYALWEGLYTLDPESLRPIPGCADRIEIDPATHEIFTFHIRPDARWSNGDPVTTADFVFAWRRMLETPGDYTYLFHYIKGAEEYEDQFATLVAKAAANQPTKDHPELPAIGPGPDFSKVGIESLDRLTLRVTLKEPVPFFPSLCAFPSFFPLNQRSMDINGRDGKPLFKHLVDPRTGQVTYDQGFTRPPYLVSNGPFRMTEWIFKRRIRMEASESYWDRANVKSRVIDQVEVEEPLAAYRTYAGRSVDWLSDVDPDIAHNLLLQPHHDDLHVFPGFGTYYFEFNCQDHLPDGSVNPLRDARVRQALSMAIDKRPIVDQVGRLGQPIATTYVPPAIFQGYSSPPGLKFDPAAARQLLADAGYPAGRGFPRLSILFNSEGSHADVAKLLRRQWQDQLGITMDLESVEIKVFGARLHSQQYAIARASWIGDYDDPSTFTDKYRSTADGNDAKWNNAEYDRLCAAAEIEPDADKRLGLLSQAESVLIQDAPVLPVYVYVNAYMFRAGVTGVVLNAKNMVMFKTIAAARQ